MPGVSAPRPEESGSTRRGRLQAPEAVDADRLLAQEGGVTVQLLNNEGQCWSSRFEAPAQRNDPRRFRDRDR